MPPLWDNAPQFPAMTFGDPEDGNPREDDDASLLPTAGAAELSIAETAGTAIVSSGRLNPGDRLLNRFRIIRFIAKGDLHQVRRLPQLRHSATGPSLDPTRGREEDK